MIPLGLELAAAVPELPGCAFVIETWLRTYRRLYRVPGLSSARWYAGQRAIICELLPLVCLALRRSAPNTVHAWACGSPGVLHYVYVAEPLRRHGVGRALVEAVAGPHGVATHVLPREAKSAFAGFAYDPFALHAALRKAA